MSPTKIEEVFVRSHEFPAYFISLGLNISLELFGFNLL